MRVEELLEVLGAEEDQHDDADCNTLTVGSCDRTLRLVLVVLNLFLATNAIIGAIWVIPALPVAWLLGTPVSSYLVPALSLAVLAGGGALISRRQPDRKLVAPGPTRLA